MKEFEWMWFKRLTLIIRLGSEVPEEKWQVLPFGFTIENLVGAKGFCIFLPLFQLVVYFYTTSESKRMKG